MPGCLLSLKQVIKISPSMASKLEVHEVFGGQDYLEKLIQELDATFPQVTPKPRRTS